MANSDMFIPDSDLYKNVFCNPVFEPDNEHDAISSEPINSPTAHINKDPAEGRVMSLNSLNGDNVHQSLVPNLTIPEYSSLMPHPEKEPLTYTKCGGVLIKSKGSITSPNHPGPYPPDSMCVWIIRISPPYLVQLYISSMAIEGPAPCLFDWLELREEDEHSTKVTRFCGNVAPATLNTNSSTVWVSFRSDSSIGGNGFLAQYQAIFPWQSKESCSTEEFMCDSGRCLLSWSVCDSLLNCQDQTDEANCSHTHKALYVAHSSRERPSHTTEFPELQPGDSRCLFCGSDLPPNLTSTGPVMSVVFVADEGVADIGFYASYQISSFTDSLSYNLTSFPNIWLSIADQTEAAYVLRQYTVLMELDCFKPLQQFVCALLVPQCSVQAGVLQPCRSVCLTAEQQCSGDLALFSLNWPLNCPLLPDSQDPKQCSMP
ncbi:Membrane frizzled-related protein [Bagarius yarrelli]|uniref:Membrane frizzled-related protein n=1 Tax=Bagarius yarrelli TaxID=175774 RepID=A0A556U7B6_BAGYA|nr:Membrane frizzled-related protein [Bagarius yarrelli]